MLYIRADANSYIASGHIMRCLTIAEEMRKNGEECIFITADEEPSALLQSKGFERICLNSRWNDLEYELNDLLRLIHEKNITHLLIDSYYVTDIYLLKLRQKCKTIYIDDLGSFSHSVDMLINYNIYWNQLGYHSWYNDSDVRLCMGLSYAPLRKEFQNRKPLISKNVKHVFITSGGSDQYNVAGLCLDEIIKRSEFKGLIFHVIVGNFNKNKEKLIDIARYNKNIELHYNVTNMYELMNSCDLAITAGGFTMYELCACGIPMICFAFADNQLPGVRGFESNNLAIYAGDIRENERLCMDKIMDGIDYFLVNNDKRIQMANALTKVVDGKGASRIAQCIINNI
ncbi:UDP-2,4-diacetamido-2,4,6-trideoxy-beta-L-altropyranose hydrolase [Anaeromicropila herbilytica]|uniref:UDP-2,4-diacetamido-2,4,6-trideoxy-beta-L-altropy ranose hydrolase n=1 Tax=Anaeromicropila herbilytica TaxID=2785025 RepID=A0A7R7IEV2_9FIRM|nr:UDP-2,4-diacetamido-2,4,6-trideoxy-beta-L-altropyranose hydrolase [Anaeromicropila herbilytica]BCN32509.1 UDP-2,4-diacetamido-2,4,6-trideoxy-beta-L-altropy ranose hydrolase [Anaeromicropila herbilytica]